MRLIDKETLCGLLADKALEAQLEDECTELAIKECLSVVRQMPEAVVRCEKCVLHGNCVTEDAFVLAGIENPFCCAGKRKEGAD